MPENPFLLISQESLIALDKHRHSKQWVKRFFNFHLQCAMEIAESSLKGMSKPERKTYQKKLRTLIAKGREKVNLSSSLSMLAQCDQLLASNYKPLMNIVNELGIAGHHQILALLILDTQMTSPENQQLDCIYAALRLAQLRIQEQEKFIAQIDKKNFQRYQPQAKRLFEREAEADVKEEKILKQYEVLSEVGRKPLLKELVANLRLLGIETSVPTVSRVLKKHGYERYKSKKSKK